MRMMIGEGENRKMQQTVTCEKISWRLAELPAATGLSLPFWRKMVFLKKIKFQKPGGHAIVILDEDLKAFLKERKGGDEDESTTANQ
jgi:hypothetical protein